MKTIITSIIIISILTIVYASTSNKVVATSLETTQPSAKAIIDTTPRVTGIGGIFFKCKSAKTTREWYGKNLGLKVNDYGSSFEFRNANRPSEVNYLEWSPFKETTKYFEPSQKQFMINYRVNNLAGLLRNFKRDGVTILDTVQSVDYGKFVHIMDDDGNKIELWEPIDSILTKLGTPTTK